MSESANHEGEGSPAGETAKTETEETEETNLAETKAGLLAELLELDPRAAVAVADARLGVRVGKLVEWASGAAPTVEFEGNERGPLPARATIPLDPTLVAEAIQDQRGVVLTFEDGRPDAPIITGLLQPLTHDVDGEAEAEAEDEADTQLEARIDGRRVELEAADEIVLRCGKASIVLRRNGRVVIRGTYVETRSRGVNRVKGGSVEIN
ncbi:hypothetical protein ENSA5_56950 [Enhygromyxa salina]|uniref:DUF6484 domain-containing protein n=1 Tax=Enhygromyxa salina TaxID=215803 RepID=A0A2S9XEJ3_9BACT|nr:DUF6484 domain-containing protein [Enhygromyxa salina]PRP91282.1 hypothetical protein ENSA5_56950 [Enhygromyxa salina]